MPRVFAIALALCLVLPVPALAAWDWTTWTMSADQVIAGSGGRLSAANGGENQRVNDWWLRATGEVRQDGFAFQGEFYFDKSGSALHVVRLTLKDPSQCERLTKVLTARHGAPVDASKSFPMGAGRTLTITVYQWDDDGAGDYLALTSLPALGSSEPLCFIRYRPVTEPDDRD